MTADFQLHDQLAADTALIADLPLSRCLLMQDARFPWIILVPRIANLRELHEVPEPVRLTLFEEIEQVSTALQQLTGAHKLNVAALGNQVPQLVTVEPFTADRRLSFQPRHHALHVKEQRFLAAG